MLLMKFIIGMMTPEMNCAFQAASKSLRVDLLELADRIGLAAEGLHDHVAGVHLLDMAVQSSPSSFCCAAKLFCELLVMFMIEEGRGGQGDQGYQREPGADRHHHDEDADDGADRGDELGEALLEARADVVDVVGHAAHDLAVGLRVEVLERQPRELGVHVLAHVVDDALGDSRHRVLLHVAEQRAEMR